MKWAYGVTTVPSRRASTLPITLASLAKGSFGSPHLFIDGDNDGASWEDEFHLPVTARGLNHSVGDNPRVRTAGNWCLALGELYARVPDADRYAIFQDDFICYANLRPYLEKCPYPPKGYLNLYTFPSNLTVCPMAGQTGRRVVGFYPSDQLGKGAVALVFSRPAVITLLTHNRLIERFQDKGRGWKVIDGGILESMKAAGWKEYVHHPSLVQHIGKVSSMGSRPHKLSTCFRGEDYDAMNLIPEW